VRTPTAAVSKTATTQAKVAHAAIATTALPVDIKCLFAGQEKKNFLPFNKNIGSRFDS
jgi:hypothetical protein